jgi:hypothetical protein
MPAPTGLLKRAGAYCLRGDFDMGKSKKDLSRQSQGIKKRIAELEEKVRMDPLKKNPANHEELETLKKKLRELA